jgi:hypothetical protein
MRKAEAMPRLQDDNQWPELPYAEWKETCLTLQLWTQIVGKIRLAHTPWLNHSWHVTLYVTARGLTTSPIPRDKGAFQIDFDFIDHVLVIRNSDGHYRGLPLAQKSVAEFYGEVIGALAELGLDTTINTMPCEIADCVPFDQDHMHAAYDRDYAHRFWRVLSSTHGVFAQFRTGFLGKASPVHFFWGSFDLAASRFSGRRAPPHPGGVPHLPLSVAREAYSHEVSSAGFWPGGGAYDAAFYSYAYPTPPGFAESPVRPAQAYFSTDLGEFILPYRSMRGSPDPEHLLIEFLESTYRAAAELARWDRQGLECAYGEIGRPRSV